MNVKVNYPKDNTHIYNLAFIKALLIKSTIDNFNIGTNEKINIRNTILEYLKNN